MKRRIRAVSAIFFLSIWGTSCSENSGDSTVYLHLQNSYDHDLVKLEMDGSEVYLDTATTNFVLSLADIDSVVVSNGNHELAVTINNTYNYHETFDVQGKIWLGINYQPLTHVISIQYSDTPYLYE